MYIIKKCSVRSSDVQVVRRGSISTPFLYTLEPLNTNDPSLKPSALQSISIPQLQPSRWSSHESIVRCKNSFRAGCDIARNGWMWWRPGVWLIIMACFFVCVWVEISPLEKYRCVHVCAWGASGKVSLFFSAFYKYVFPISFFTF